MNLNEGDKIASLAKVAKEDLEQGEEGRISISGESPAPEAPPTETPPSPEPPPIPDI
jgi:hypothetical protein